MARLPPSSATIRTTSTPLKSLLHGPLRTHLQTTDLISFYRPDLSQLHELTLPHISSMELVTGHVFLSHYATLYIQSFPDATLRENIDEIAERLRAQDAGERKGLGRFCVVGMRGTEGEVIGAAHFSIMTLRNRPGFASRKENARGPEPEVCAVPFLQYIYVDQRWRRKGMGEVLHALVLAITAAEVHHMRRSNNNKETERVNGGKLTNGDANGHVNGHSNNTRHASSTCLVPFTLFETEPSASSSTTANSIPGDPSTEPSLLAKIYTRSGAHALMLRSTAPSSNRPLLSAHLSPGMTPAASPFSLLFGVRACPACDIEHDLEAWVRDRGDEVIAAYYHSLREEGFEEEDVSRAEKIFWTRRKGREWCLVGLEAVHEGMCRNEEGEGEV